LKNELEILIESLQKKICLLNEILMNSKKQLAMTELEKFDLEEFDESVNKKTDLIKKMDQNDQGFDVVFDRVKTELIDNQNEYLVEIAQMQDLIRKILDIGSEIHVVEKQSREGLERYFKENKSKLQKGRRDGNAVLNYYKQVNQTDYVAPMFMDQKK